MLDGTQQIATDLTFRMFVSYTNKRGSVRTGYEVVRGTDVADVTDYLRTQYGRIGTTIEILTCEQLAD